MTPASQSQLELPDLLRASKLTRKVELGLDTVSILGSQSDSSKQGSALVLQGQLGGDARAGDFLFAGQLDVRAWMSKSPVLGVEAPEVYLAYAPKDSALRMSLGRKLEEWSQVDEVFGLGIWQPRFLWNRARPESAGLFGASVGAVTSDLRLQATFIPVFVPDRGFPVSSQDGQLLTQDPYFDGPGQSVSLYGTETPVSYQVVQPKMTNILFNPGVAALARVGASPRRQGSWGQIAYAYKPMNQLRFAYDSVLRLDSNPQHAEVTIYPEVVYHHVATLEGGVQSGSLRGWASVATDRPVTDEALDAQQAATMTLQTFEPAQTYALGGGWSTRLADLSASFIHVSGGQSPDIGENASGGGSAFESRYPFENALSLGALVPISRSRGGQLNASTRLLIDVTNSGTVWSTELEWKMGRGIEGFAVRGGADLLASGLDADSADASTSWISRYRARDRVHLGVAYVF